MDKKAQVLNRVESNVNHANNESLAISKKYKKSAYAFATILAAMLYSLGSSCLAIGVVLLYLGILSGGNPLFLGFGLLLLILGAVLIVITNMLSW